MLKNRLNHPERRQHPRLQKLIPLKVQADSFDLAAQTHNISLSGICCQVDKSIELMSNVTLLLVLPVKRAHDKAGTKQVHCKGVVVRVEEAKEAKGKFDIAVFFNDLKESDANAIREYIESHLQEPVTPFLAA